MIKKRLHSAVIVCMQVIAYLLLALPLRIYFRANRRLPQNLSKLRRGALVVSNHQSRKDPFFVLACIPFFTFLRILPIRFPVLNKYYYSPLFNPRLFPLLTMLGCFPVGETSDDRMKAMFLIRSLLKKGSTVLIFPEGKIHKSKGVGGFQQGIDFFTKDANQIIFVRIHGLNGVYHDDYAEKRSCRVVFSDVFLPQLATEKVDFRKYLDSLQ